jgi:hypothetical protein
MNLRQFGRFLALMLCITILVPMAQGQEFRGKIQGLVTDPSKAVVPGATVTLLNIKTGVQTVKITNQTGLYRFDNVDSGSYTLTVELTGFSKFVQENITVEARADITVNAMLKVGGSNETVTVTESPVGVAFNTTNIALTVDSKLSAELPRLDRNPFKLAYLNPAVQDTRRQEVQPFLSWAANSMELGGGTNQKNDLQVDGSAVGAGTRSSYTPNTDAVQEVNVQQNSVDAEVGHSAGGLVSMTLKSGTNEWHGTASWVHREPNWNAITDRIARTSTGQRNNVFSGTLGNPIIKNKLFNFASVEIWRMGTPGNVLYQVPTDLERQGDFSQSLNTKGQLRKIYDPWSTVVSGGVVTRTQFQDNKIPANRIDPITAKVMAALWKPNRTPDNVTGAGNFTATYTSAYKYWNLSDRVDWFVNDKLRIYGRYSTFRTTSDRVDSLLYPMEFYVPQGEVRNAYNYSGDGIYTANNTTVAQFHFAWHTMYDDFTAKSKDLGPNGFSKYWPNSNWYVPFRQDEFETYFPTMTVGSAATMRVGQGGLWYQHPGGWSWSAKLSQQRGAHFLKAGFEMRNSNQVMWMYPGKWSFTFPAALTADTYLSPDTKVVGSEYATFLLGALDQTSVVGYKVIHETQVNMYGAYLQDDWKVNRRITLNLGLRYELETPWTDPNNYGSIGMDLTKVNTDIQSSPPVLPASVTALRTAAPTWNGAWNFVTPDHPGLWDTQKFVFMPRIGMALKIDDKTALRVGWARFVTPTEMLQNPSGIYSGGGGDWLSAPYMGYDTVQNPLALNNGVPQQTISNPFPSSNPLLAPKGNTYGKYYGLGENNISWVNAQLKRAVNDRINVTFSRQLANQIVAEATYFTNIGRNLSMFARDLNAWDPRIGYNLPTASKSTMDANVANPFYNYLTSTLYPGPLRNNKNIATKQLLRPYPQYGGLWQTYDCNEGERYHALQLKAQRAFKNGYNFMVGYNYRREKQQGFYDELDQFLDKLTWLEGGPQIAMSTGTAAPHHSLSIAGTYELPFGKGRQFGASMPKALDYAFGGWQLVGAYYFNSGAYLVFGPMVATGDPHLDNPTPAKWFDTSMFSVLPAYTQRTNPRTYSDVRGPTYWDIQASIGKTFAVGEKFKTQMKLIAYNLTNHLNRANPDTVVTSTTFGRSYQQLTGTTGRQLEVALKILF